MRRLMIGLIAAPGMAWAMTGLAAAETSTEWLQARIGMATTVQTAGEWTPAGGAVYAIDPIVVAQTGPATLLRIPEAPARVVGLMDAEHGHTALFALLWSDAPVTCGDTLSNVAVDAGVARFPTPEHAAAIGRYGPSYGTTYVGAQATQLLAAYANGPSIIDLRDVGRFPVTASGWGWGDGAYPVAVLRDAGGDFVALNSQFLMGGDDSLLPRPCQSPLSMMDGPVSRNLTPRQ